MYKQTVRFDNCKYHSINYTSFDIFGHDDYMCYCSQSGENKECSYLYCSQKCDKGVKKDSNTIYNQ